MHVAEFITQVNNKQPNDLTENNFVQWINILEDTMYSKHILDHEKPEPKTLEGMGVEKLSILEFGYRWLLLYEYFILGQICLSIEEYGKANNYLMLYNSLIDEFVQYYYPKLPNTVREDRLKNFR